MDGKGRTFWDSGATQASGMVYRVDMGTTQTVCKIRFDLGDRSRTARSVSGGRLDGRLRWTTVMDRSDPVGGSLLGRLAPAVSLLRRHFTAAFAPVTARYVNITVTRPSPGFWWSIAELRMYSPAGSGQPLPGGR